MGLVAALVTSALAVSGLPARADTVRDSQWSLGFLHIAEAQRISQGEGVTVAVLDTGVDQYQPDIAGSVVPGLDAVTPARDGRTDQDGHGTDMAVLIAGHGHGVGNADGLLGVAPKAKILPVTVWPPGTTSLRPKDVATGIRWAVDHGAQVINISGGGSSNPELEAAVEYAISAGAVVVAAIGNAKQVVVGGFPAVYPDVIAVSGVDENGNFASGVSVRDVAIDFAAPAVGVMTPDGSNGYAKVDGTSVAAALVSGVVALVKAKFPTLNAEQVLDLLKATAIDKGPTGLDDQYGWGIVDPVAALTKGAAGASGSLSGPVKPTDSSGGSDAGDGDPGSHKVLIGAALAGGLIIVVVILTVSVIGLRRRRSPLR